MIRILICGLMATARLVELRISKRNIASQLDRREGGWSRGSFPAMVAMHTVVIGGTALLGTRKTHYGWLALLLGVQPLRWWVLNTLGKRWTVRGAVPREMEIETTGPYAYVRHPNYAVVAVELATLPAAFGLNQLAVLATIANAALLTLRIHDEEALLFELPGYAEHFSDKPRFVPRRLRLRARIPVGRGV
jgi:methyltransferase